MRDVCVAVYHDRLIAILKSETEANRYDEETNRKFNSNDKRTPISGLSSINIYDAYIQYIHRRIKRLKRIAGHTFGIFHDQRHALMDSIA